MKKITLIIAVIITVCQLSLSAQAWQWAVSSQTEEAFYSTTDPSGNVYQIGKYAGTGTFQGGVTLSQGGAYYNNWFIAKYNTSGQLQWAKEAFSQKGDREVMAFTSDAEGNIYYAGYFDDTLRVESSSAVSHGARDAFLVKMNSSGNLQWIKTGGGVNDDSFNDIACANSNVYAVGSFVPDATFETVTITGSTVNFSSEAMLLSYSSAGNLNFAKSFGGISQETGDGIYVYNNKIYFSGYFHSSTATFQTISLNWTGTGGDFDTYLACTDLSGNIEFAKGFHNGFSSLLFRNTNTLFVNNSGIYMSGQFFEQINFGNGPISINGSAQNAYLAKFDFSGINIWATTFKGEKFVSAQKVIGNNDHIYVAGNFSDSISILGQNYVGLCESAGLGKNNGFITSWNNDGTMAWIKTIHPYQNPDYLAQMGVFRLNGFSMDNNFLYMSGVFTMTLPLYPHSVSTDGVLSNNDAVIAKIDITANGIEEISQSTLNCYPNPATNHVTIETKMDENYVISIKNMNGQVMLTQKSAGITSATLDIRQLSKGIYILEVHSKNNIESKKLVIQ
ncbi:MAG: T9SS type A sorting domain-containing protein [Bacteroidota bacterium]